MLRVEPQLLKPFSRRKPPLTAEGILRSIVHFANPNGGIKLFLEPGLGCGGRKVPPDLHWSVAGSFHAGETGLPRPPGQICQGPGITSHFTSSQRPIFHLVSSNPSPLFSHTSGESSSKRTGSRTPSFTSRLRSAKCPCSRPPSDGCRERDTNMRFVALSQTRHTN